MTDVFKLAATSVIWLMSAIMIGVTVGNGNVTDPFSIPVIAMIVAAAVFATRSVWHGGIGGIAQQSMVNGSEKAKRSPKQRLQNVLTSLDEEEAAALLEDFRARLANSEAGDGEISAVDALRAERTTRRYD